MNVISYGSPSAVARVLSEAGLLTASTISKEAAMALQKRGVVLGLIVKLGNRSEIRLSPKDLAAAENASEELEQHGYMLRGDVLCRQN